MTIVEAGDGTIVVTYDSTGLTKTMLAATGVLLAVAAYDVSIGARGAERLVGLLGTAATCFLVAMVFLENAWFHFEPASRVVTWRRRWALRQRSGSIPFDAIRTVLVERPIGDEGTPSRRITLKTASGEAIPITVGYRPDVDGAVLRIAARIRAILGLDAGTDHKIEVKALIASGRTIDAIRVLREAEGLSLVDAKRRVDEISAGRTGS